MTRLDGNGLFRPAVLRYNEPSAVQFMQPAGLIRRANKRIAVLARFSSDATLPGITSRLMHVI